MGKIIVSGDLEDLGTISSRSEASGYADDNVEDYWHLKRRFRADDLTTNDWLLKFNFGATLTVAAIFLNDVNFDTVKVQGHASDSWASPSYDGSNISISHDERVDRYKVYIPLTGFSYKWMRLVIPSGTSATGDYQTKWEVGSVVALGSVVEFSRNMSYGYTYGAGKEYHDLPFKHGGFERADMGGELRWSGDLVFSRRPTADGAELWQMNRLCDMGLPVVFYENDSDTSKAYLCLRDNGFQAKLVQRNAIVGNTIRLKELV